MTGAPGRFVTFEGVDGAGKSTQLAHAAAYWKGRGHDVVATREPGGSAGAEAIRTLLVGGAPERWSAETELLLFTAARRDHVERTLRPALARGALVLCDRYVDSTRAYQAAGRGADPSSVEALHGLMIGLDPDLTLVFDLDPAAARARRPNAGAGPDEHRFERFDADFHERLRGAFLAIAAREPARVRVIDAGRPAEAVAAEANARIAALLGEAAA